MYTLDYHNYTMHLEPVNSNNIDGTIAKATRLAIIYNVTGLLLSIICAFFNNYISTAILLLYPLAGIAIMAFGGGTTKFLADLRIKTYPLMAFGIFTPIIALVYKAVNVYLLFSLNSLWLPFIAICLIITVSLYFTGLNKPLGQVKHQIIIMFMAGIGYGFGGTIQINCVYDNTTPKRYPSTIIGMHISSGKHLVPFLFLSAWGPRDKDAETAVDRSFYDEVKVGETVNVNLHSGLLNIPWITVSH